MTSIVSVLSIHCVDNYLSKTRPREKLDDRALAAEYIAQEVRDMGLTPDIVVKERQDTTIQNVVVTIPGETDEIIVVGAHYDVQNSLSPCWRGKTSRYRVTQGADDNTSGVVGCLALLKFFAENKPLRTLRVVLFDGEEPGSANRFCSGSQVFVDNIEFEEKIIYALIIDMIGGPPTNAEYGLFLAISYGFDESALSASVAEFTSSYIQKHNITCINQDSEMSCLKFTDSSSFMEKGIPSLLLSNVAGVWDVPDFYHTEMDTVEVMDWDSFLFAVAVMIHVAGSKDDFLAV